MNLPAQCRCTDKGLDGGGLQVEYEAGQQSTRCAISNPHIIGGKSSPCVQEISFAMDLLIFKRFHLALA